MNSLSATAHRKSIRLKEYDYSQEGAYYITICVQNRENRFGEIKKGEMFLYDAGKMINDCWKALPERYPSIILDAYVTMPNHFHGIIMINYPDDDISNPIVGAGLVPAMVRLPSHERAPTRGAPTHKTTIGEIIGAFKSITTNEYIIGVKNKHWPSFNKRIWQRNYYEHIIRNEDNLDKIREYILENPYNWEKDELYQQI